MQLSKTICISAIFSCLLVGTVSGQTLRNAAEPAEIPAASYAGNQYVDSRGCVYVRAGFNGKTTWVPRVSRNRQQVCGFKPTLAGATEPAAAVAPATSSAAVVAPVSGTVTNQVARRSEKYTSVRRSTKKIALGRLRSAWDDGRLNVNRGPRTDAGNVQMGQIWTDKVPMTLITN